MVVGSVSLTMTTPLIRPLPTIHSLHATLRHNPRHRYWARTWRARQRSKKRWRTWRQEVRLSTDHAARCRLDQPDLASNAKLPTVSRSFASPSAWKCATSASGRIGCDRRLVRILCSARGDRRACGQGEGGKFQVISKSKAKSDFLVTDTQLDGRTEDGLGSFSLPNPHDS